MRLPRAARFPLRLALVISFVLANGAAHAEAPEVRLTWRVDRETQVYGYLVYRASAREGPFLRVNAEIIRRKSGAGAHDYSFVDREVVTDRTYFYYLETIDRQGRKGRFSGVQSRTVSGAPNR